MRKYAIEYWSDVDWSHTYMEVLADSEEQVRDMVDKDVPPETRVRRGKDSLIIMDMEDEEVTMPYVLLSRVLE